MREFKNILKSFKLAIKFAGPLKDLDFWQLYAQEEALEINAFTALYDSKSLPYIIKDATTEAQVDKLLDLSTEFKAVVSEAVRPYRCLCCKTSFMLFQKEIFGTLDQLRFMLEKNFDGRHFWVKSKTDKDLSIDAMFFPCTSEKVLSAEELKESRDAMKADPEYLTKPTIIMCNPNALFYHHMVNSPNSYWLNLFLKKGINVMGWNYRGYGETPGTCTPYNIKSDGESVLNFVVNELCLQGKVGVYGRSLGGVVASHLAATYPDRISMIIADRTFGNLRDVSSRKFRGAGTGILIDFLTFQWETHNDLNYIKVS